MLPQSGRSHDCKRRCVWPMDWRNSLPDEHVRPRKWSDEDPDSDYEPMSLEEMAGQSRELLTLLAIAHLARAQCEFCNLADECALESLGMFRSTYTCARAPSRKVFLQLMLHVLGGSAGRAILKLWNAILNCYVWGDTVHTHGSLSEMWHPLHVGCPACHALKI